MVTVVDLSIVFDAHLSRALSMICCRRNKGVVQRFRNSLETSTKLFVQERFDAKSQEFKQRKEVLKDLMPKVTALLVSAPCRALDDDLYRR
jgi:hypothetical protein